MGCAVIENSSGIIFFNGKYFTTTAHADVLFVLFNLTKPTLFIYLRATEHIFVHLYLLFMLHIHKTS